MTNPFLSHARIQHPIICGAMYPCSNPELIAAASAAGALGVIQPLSLIYAQGYDLTAGIAKIRSLTSKPIGFNAIVEQSSKTYENRMRAWVDIALDADIRFFITALGKPGWVVEKVHAAGGYVYHDVTRLSWAEKAVEAGVDGLICVNDRAGGHLGDLTKEQLWQDLSRLGKPLICAGGIGTRQSYREALALGYSGVQLGTKFIATTECSAHPDYKAAIVRAQPADIVSTNRISGVPVSIINTPYLQKSGLNAGPVARYLLRGRRTKHAMRLIYTAQSLWRLKNSSFKKAGYKAYWQAGKSVDGVDKIQTCAEVVNELIA